MLRQVELPLLRQRKTEIAMRFCVVRKRRYRGAVMVCRAVPVAAIEAVVASALVHRGLAARLVRQGRRRRKDSLKPGKHAANIPAGPMKGGMPH